MSVGGLPRSGHLGVELGRRGGPLALRAGYRIATWANDEEPPWRADAGRREITLALKDTSKVDPRSSQTMAGSHGARWSIGSGPAAPVEVWQVYPSTGNPHKVEAIGLPAGQEAWIYEPPSSAGETPLLVLFDGQVWLQLGLPDILDRAIVAGKVPPIHVAMLDSGDLDHRWAHLGVPGGQVDTVIDELLPRVRSGWPVSHEGSDTWVSGQSLGGIASLWTLALSGGQVGRAIAQSPSLWRFDIADALLAEPGWTSILMQSGTYEPDMLRDAMTLRGTLRANGPRPVEVAPAVGGHDWAVWRAGLLGALAGLRP